MRRVALAALGLTVAGLVLCIAWLLLEPLNALPAVDASLDVVLAVASIVFASVGWLIVRRANNRTGLVFSFAGLGGSFLASTDILVRSTPSPHPTWLPWAGLLSIVGQVLAIGSLTTLLPIFPTGSLPSPRWRWVAWLWAAGIGALAAAALLRAGAMDLNTPGVVNPVGIGSVDPLLDVAAQIGGIALVGTVVAGLASLVVRSRRGGPEVRAQVRWLTYVGGLALGFFLLSGVGAITGGQDSAMSSVGWLGFLLCLLVGIPTAVAIAVLKYRLFEIDVVIRKTVVVGLLALFITVVYVAIVVGIGAFVAGTFALQIAATAVVALAFQPARERANRLASRLVYGKRATPYDVLARFADRIGETYASEDVVRRIARVIAEGTTAERVDVWLRVGDELRMSGAWPDHEPPAPMPTSDESLPPIEGDRVVPVRHRGELLGAIAVTEPATEPLTPNEGELLDRLAEQAGLVLSNVDMTADLEARLEQISRQAAELRASRQRIVAAQDEERRRLERNIHDGAQQHLVALAVKLRLARSVLERDPERGRAMLHEIRAEVDAALDTLRALALGIYPPLLEKHGIADALAAQSGRSTLPVHLESDGLARYPIDLEAAVYFSVLEALQNAAKYANAGSIEVHLSERAGAVEFAVEDDGIGFDPSANGVGTGLEGIRDRLAVFGGKVRVESQQGRGTVVRGRVPVSERSER